jgi:hypothetical protein
MMDERTKHGRHLRRLRAAARRWSALAGTLVGTAAVLTPYEGLGVGDAGWAAAAGGSLVLAAWRWADYREYAARPVPAADANRVAARVEAFLVGVPWGRELVSGLRRQVERGPLRGSAVAAGWARLDRAAAILGNLAPGPGSPVEAAILEAAAAERGLRQLAKRTAGLERGRSYVGQHDAFDRSLTALISQFEQGVNAYEDLVGAAVACAVEEGRTTPDHQTLRRMTEAADLLRGVAQGFAELRTDDRLPA